MKYYLPLIASLFLLSGSYSSSVAEVEADKITQSIEVDNKETETTVTDIDPYIKDNIAPEISVKISSGGSGVIIAQEDNTYLVLTNKHVLLDGEEFTIDTHDGVTHQATEAENGIDTDDDLALLQFTSSKEYQTAIINTAATPKAEQAVLAVGYSAETGKLVTESGKIEQIPDKTLKEGYSIGYTSNIVQGMSGGAILNIDGEVIGINGKSAFPIVNTGYINEDGTKPNAEEIEELRQLSWGLSLNRLLARVNPEIITAYNLPLPETTDSIENDPLTGWLAELEARAKQITVRIDSSSGANGSGVIIAKEGNTYTVLTADHVLCEKDDERQCIGYDYEIVTSDGEKYTLGAGTVKAESGVDLATFRFTSNEPYQVAQLADYPIQNDNAVFVAGYPQLGTNTPPQWQFSLGFGLEKETGLSSVNINSNSSDSESSAALSQTSLAGGYEMVYTSPTYGGMSGGAVLDKEGRVIGIHGQAEGETTISSQGGAPSKIQMGYSLGIPISTFMGLKARLGAGEKSSIAENAPAELNPNEQEAFEVAILGMEIADSNATAKRWLERGNRLWRLKRYSEAAAAFDKAIDLNETEFNYLAHYGKGLALSDIGKDELALASLEKATTSNSEFTPAFQDKSYVLLKLNRFDEALIAIDTAIAIEPKNANYYSLQSIALLGSKGLEGLEEAIVAYNRAIEITPRSTFYLNRGSFYAQQGEIELALADYKQAIKINPNYAGAYNNRGLIYNNRGEAELALADYNRAIKIDPKLATAYNDRGLIYNNQGEAELALADYNRAIKIDPKLETAYYNRGLLYDNQGEIELALANYDRAIQINPNYARAYNNRAILYKDKGEVELALTDYNQAIQIDPKNATAYYNRAILYDKQGKLELAWADFKQAIKIDPDYAGAYNSRGSLYAKQGEVELALADYNRAIQINSKDAIAYYNRGVIYAQQGEVELAFSNYDRAIQINPNYASAYINRGILYDKQGKPELAFSDHNQAVQIDPKDADAYINRAILYDDRGETELALADYNRAIQIDPKDADAYINRAILYESQGETELALADYDRAIKINPQLAVVYFGRAVLYQSQGETELALADYNRAIQISPKDFGAYYNRAILYNSQGETELALADYDRAIQISPKDASAYNNRGLLYKDTGEVELALADYDRAIRIDPKLATAYYNRGLLYKDTGETELALADFNKALKINPKDANVYINRGAVYDEQGKLELALADFNKALKINPKDANVYINRGAVYGEQGKLELALSDYNQAIKLNPNSAEAYGNLGLIHEELSNIEEARFNLQKAQQLFIAQGKMANARKVASLLQQDTGEEKADVSERNSVETSESNPQSADEYYDRAFKYHQEQEYDLALDDYSKVIEINPSNEKAFINRGLIYASQGKDELALADYNKAIAINPNNSAAYRNRGVLYFEQEKYKLAELDWDDAIAVNPKDAQAYYNRGLLHKELANYRSVKSDLEIAQRLAVLQENDDLARKAANALVQLP